MRDRLLSYMRPMIGMTLWGHGVAAGMSTFQVGPSRLVPGYRGEPRQLGEFAIHVQCPWRISRRTRILVASADATWPAGMPYGERRGFDWDGRGASLMEERVHSLLGDDSEGAPTILAVEVDTLAGFVLQLERGMAFEAFPDTSLPQEHWRVFRPATDGGHLVVSREYELGYDDEGVDWA